MATPRSLVAESAFSFLHMELVQIALGPDAAMSPTPSQLQLASRKIEAIGFQVGQRLIERYTKDRPRFTETLEIIKFICKDFWVDVYRKQIDKLQTNNRVSVIHFACAYATLYYAHYETCSVWTGRLHAAGQFPPGTHAMLTNSFTASVGKTHGSTAHQIPKWPDPWRSLRIGSHSFCFRRGE